MKKLLIWILSVVLIVVTADILFGVASRYYISKYQLKGDYRSSDHLINDSIEELIVLGSSVALNSIDTKALADSLKITSFNGGSNGQTLPFYLTLMEIIAQKPGLKTVILGMNEQSFNDTGLGPRYNFLIPYYDMGHEAIDQRFENNSKLDRLLLKSSLYRYNNIWFRILLYAFIEPGLKGENGFVAKDLPAYFPRKTILTTINDSVTTERADEFDQFVNICAENNIRLIVCVPPRYEQRQHVNAGERFLKERAKNKDFELWFDASSTDISEDSTLFFDNVHLNYIGARRYTNIIIDRLKQYETEE